MGHGNAVDASLDHALLESGSRGLSIDCRRLAACNVHQATHESYLA